MTARAIAAAFVIIAIPLALGAQTATPKTIGEVTLFGEEQLKIEAATKTEIPRVSYDFPNTRLRATLFGNNLLNRRPEETMVGVVNRIAGRELFAQMEMRY